MQSNAISDDNLDVPKPAVAKGLPHGFKNVEELDIDETSVIELFEKNNHKVHLGVRVKSDILRPTVSVFDTSAGRILATNPFFQ